MRAIQTSLTFPLSSVKPLDGLRAYRAFCLEAARKALAHAPRSRRCPVDGCALEPFGEVDGLPYGRCRSGGGLFLAQAPSADAWAGLLAEVGRFRRSPKAFHADIAQSRTDNVYAPKLEWIRDALRMQRAGQPRILEVVTSPSEFSALLQDAGVAAEVLTVEESPAQAAAPGPQAQAAILLESLDRSDDPAALLEKVLRRLEPGSLVFVTGLVSSGFDMSALGLHNLYLYPPDRANCFSLQGFSTLLTDAGLSLVEVSTPGVLDVEIVRAHLAQQPSTPLSAFERQVVGAEGETQSAFQAFLQQQGLSSFARIVARTPS